MMGENSPTSICSAGSAGSPSPQGGQASAQSPLSKSSRSARKSCENIGPMSQSMTTSEHSSGQEKGQLSLPGASPASPSRRPGSDEARRMTVGSGRKCSELFRRQSHVGSLVRMLLASSTWDSTKCYLTWKAKATKQGRLLFQLAPRTPRTEGTGCGYAPIILKTPSTVETEGGVMEIRPGCDGHYKLRDQIASVHKAMLPTPLNERIWGLIETPTTTMYKGSGSNTTVRTRLDYKVEKTKRGKLTGLKLQPAFVEWMMGYPLGFTHVEPPGSRPSETPSSRKSRQKSSRGSQTLNEER